MAITRDDFEKENEKQLTVGNLKKKSQVVLTFFQENPDKAFTWKEVESKLPKELRPKCTYHIVRNLEKKGLLRRRGDYYILR